jgi:hypothetical protein
MIQDTDLQAVTSLFFERWNAFADICQSPERESGAVLSPWWRD